MTDPVAHDTELHALLTAASHAAASVATAKARLYTKAADARADHTGHVRIADPRTCRSTTMKLVDLPVGTLYYQAKTFHRGDEGFWVKTDSLVGRRRATVTDALTVLPADDPAVVAYHAAKSASSAAVAAVVSHEKHYTGWNRYFLVTSSAGHVHRSMNCSTCYPSTTYSPVVALSGHTDTEAVAVLGETLCTVCFPDAPVASGKPRKLTAAAARKLAG